MIKDFVVTYSCNNFCRFCVLGNKRNQRNLIFNKYQENFFNILDIERQKSDGVVFTGGEPTIDKDLVNYVEYSKKINYKIIGIQTNGRMFSYKSYCLSLIDAGVNSFNVLMLSSNYKIHDYLTRVPGSFNQTIQGIKNLIELKQDVAINFVITNINYKDILDTTKMMINLGIKDINFIFMKYYLEKKDNMEIIEISPRYSQVEKYLKKGLEFGINKNIKVRYQDFPNCFMTNHREYLVHDTHKENKSTFCKFEIKAEKIKHLKCKECNFYKECEGVWEYYTDVFGWDEFKPIKEKNI